MEEIARWQKTQASALGARGGETGSVTFVQRFNATLGTFVHLHVVALDGVFTRIDGGAAVFHEGPAPSQQDVASVATRVAARMTRWLRRRGLIDERAAEERSNEAPEVSPLEACLQLSLTGGLFLRLTDRGEGLAEGDEERRFRGVKKRPHRYPRGAPGRATAIPERRARRRLVERGGSLALCARTCARRTCGALGQAVVS